MILQLYAFFVGISLILIYLGLTRPSESAQALIGFLFLFLLSFVVMNNNLEIRSGEIVNASFSYDPDGLLVEHSQIMTYTYDVYDDDSSFWFNTHRFGLYLAIASVIGFVGVLIGLKGGWRNV